MNTSPRNAAERQNGRSGNRRRHRDSTTPSTSSSHSSSSESPDLRRAVTVEGDRAVFSKIMQITTSAVRNLWKAEGLTSVDDLACLYTKPRQVWGCVAQKLHFVTVEHNEVNFTAHVLRCDPQVQ